MKRLSIIVPIYNVEHYLGKCLRSLEDQDIPKTDYEIICVNDGSPDKSREVVIYMQSKFKNIILIDQENRGVSYARNVGIDHSSGKYLMFIDPDDYVQRNSFSPILKAADSKNAQIAITGKTFLDANGNVFIENKFDNYENKLYTGLKSYFITHDLGQIDGEFFRRNSL